MKFLQNMSYPVFDNGGMNEASAFWSIGLGTWRMDEQVEEDDPPRGVVEFV